MEVHRAECEKVVSPNSGKHSREDCHMKLLKPIIPGIFITFFFLIEAHETASMVYSGLLTSGRFPSSTKSLPYNVSSAVCTVNPPH